MDRRAHGETDAVVTRYTPILLRTSCVMAVRCTDTTHYWQLPANSRFSCIRTALSTSCCTLPPPLAQFKMSCVTATDTVCCCLVRAQNPTPLLFGLCRYQCKPVSVDSSGRAARLIISGCLCLRNCLQVGDYVTMQLYVKNARGGGGAFYCVLHAL